MATTKKSTLTYAEFALWAVLLANGEEPEGYDKKLFIEKAQKLADREAKKSTYNAAKAKKAPSKVSPETKENAELILSALTTEPKTTSEINAELETDFQPLTISNAIRYLENEYNIVRSKKVEKVTSEKEGVKLTREVPRAAYALVE